MSDSDIERIYKKLLQTVGFLQSAVMYNIDGVRIAVKDYNNATMYFRWEINDCLEALQEWKAEGIVISKNQI